MSNKVFVLSSTNSAKKQAAVDLLANLYGDGCELHCVDVDSGVAETPTTEDEGIRGALARIENARRVVPDADGYLEGIVTKNSYGTFLCGWAVVELADGRKGYGCSAKLRLPDELMEGFEGFRKLSDMTAAAHPDRANLLPRLGTNGVLTNGLYTRVDEFEDALKCAFGGLHVE